MPLVGIYLITAAGVALALCAPLELAFAAVLGAWMLIPAGLILPGLLHIFLVDRVILAAFAFRLLVRFRMSDEPPASAYRFTPLHFALAALLLVGYVDGALMAPGSLHDNLVVWLTLLDATVFFIAALAVLRSIGIWPVVRSVAVVAGIAVGIGLIERITGHGWAGYLAEHVPAAYQSSYVFPLATRGGSVRAQAASGFALEFGWVLAMLLPLLAVAVSVWIDRHRRWGPRRHLLVLLPGAAVLAVIFTASRSAEIAVAVGAVLLVILAGAPRRLTTAVVISGVVVLVVAVLDPSLIVKPFTAASHTNSISSRLQRLPILFDLVVHRPFLGVGYTGYSSVLIGADDGYALTYGQLGILGFLSFLAVLGTFFAVSLRTLRSPVTTTTRFMGAACIIGILGVAVASGAYDLTFTEQSLWTLMLLGALSVVLSERVPRSQRVARSPLRVVLPLVGAALGAVVLAVAPVGWSRSYTVYVISPNQLAQLDPSLLGWTSGQLASTFCAYLDTRVNLGPGTDLRCSQPGVLEQATWYGEVSVRIAAPSAQGVDTASQRALYVFYKLGYPTVAANGPIATGKPSWAITAPVSGAFAGFMTAALLPPLRRRRRSVAALRPAFAT